MLPRGSQNCQRGAAGDKYKFTVLKLHYFHTLLYISVIKNPDTALYKIVYVGEITNKSILLKQFYHKIYN